MNANIRQSVAFIALFLALLTGTAQAAAPYAQVRVFAPGGIAIDWEHPNDGASSITLERESPANTWTFVALVNSFNDLGLNASTSYRYRVCAIYAGNPDCTPWMAATTMAASAGTMVVPGAPVFTSSSSTVDSITVNWSSAPGFSFHQIRWAEDGHEDGQQRASGRTFTAGGLHPGNYHFIVQGCNTTLAGSSCSNYSLPVWVSTRMPMPPPPPPPPPVVILSKGVIYGVTLNDDLMWYRHDGRNDGSAAWATPEAKQVGRGWEFKQLFASSGYLYGIKNTGELMWYHHLGREDGSFRWEEGKQVGTGWGALKNVFSGGGDIIYAVEPETGGPSAVYGKPYTPVRAGRLLWYRHVGQADGSFRWQGPKVVGTGWSAMKQVFYGGDGIVYAIQENGDLMWGRHLGRGDGTFRWEGLKKVGQGWGGFIKVFSGGDGVIYAVQDNGDLMWYRHNGHLDGSDRWAFAEGKRVATGWYKFNLKQIFTD
jgi:hypothetical protein